MTTGTSEESFDIDHYVTVTQDIITYSLLLLGISAICLAVSSAVYFDWF